VLSSAHSPVVSASSLELMIVVDTIGISFLVSG
jgi:hypothetical protein